MMTMRSRTLVDTRGITKESMQILHEQVQNDPELE